MAVTRTTLSAAIKAGDLTIPVVSTATGFPAVGQILSPSQPVMIDQEMMFLVQVPAINILLVRSRGADGQQAVAHDVGAPVLTSASPGDFPVAGYGFSLTNPVEGPRTLTYGQSGAITLPPASLGGEALLNGAAALAMTLAAPPFYLTGTTFAILTQSAFAHVVSAPALFFTGAAGGPFGTLTFPAQIGAQVDLIAQNGVWNVSGINGAVVFT